ncbi:MAG TPA: transketolase [Anaerolineae bacterium]|nr:transketolase [Anaerolineae bacterium]
MTDSKSLDRLCADTLRMLAADGVQKANSGHPGMPMGMADAAYVLWTRFLKHNPANPQWPDRDRFVLSAGHGSMLLYSLLHLTGYDLPLAELMRFRQWGSLTPGHPEHGLTPGVEATTGPLGQGFSMGVGMALAERWLAARFNRPSFPIVDHYTYAIVSDGDLMEGISHEAGSLAGHLGLGKLIYLYDDNRISIEGPTDLAFTEDMVARFRAYGWHVQRVDGHDPAQVDDAIRAAQVEEDRPSIIACRTHIGFGSPHKQDTAEVHGAPLGEEELRLTKEKLGWPQEPSFYIPEDAQKVFGAALEQGAVREVAWRDLFARYAQAHPDLAAEFERTTAGVLPEGWEEALPKYTVADGAMATRNVSGSVLNAVAAVLPELLGGSADLHPSNKTFLKGFEDIQRGRYGGRNLHFGVREHAMGAVLNGLALHGGIIPYGGTFLVFSDYMRPSIRLAALMEAHVIYVFTHDSIGVGEDGPTHQPVEHVAALRAIPGLTVMRPADARETVEAWRVALKHRHGPVALALTRQGLPTLDLLDDELREGVERGGYVLADEPALDVILLASGSEVSLAMVARGLLAEQDVAARVVSMPSWELFDAQSQSYRDAVLLPGVARVAVEAGISQGWHRYVGLDGAVVAMDRFGASAPYKTLMQEFGFTAENVVAQVLELLGKVGN